MIKNLDCQQRLSRARTQLLLNQPFFGTLCLRLKLTASAAVPTMATDGRRLLYNPAFVNQLSEPALEGVLAHEVLHCALAHHCRRGGREPELWNEAADYAINPILIGNGMTLPEGILVNAAFDNLSAEEIYARLWNQRAPGQEPRPGPQAVGSPAAPQTGAPMPGQGGSLEAVPAAAGSARPGAFGEVIDATDDDGNPASQAETSRQQHEWAIATEQAIRSAQACGRAPGSLERPVREARESVQDWRAILRDFIVATSPADYRWTPPNRRFIASRLYLPSVERNGIGEIVIVVDTSGSIGSAELEQFAGEITAIANEAKPGAIHVVYCDAAVRAVEQFGPADQLELAPAGGGGTDFRPPFEWVQQQSIEPRCLIYLTDLCCNSYPEPPAYPVLWITNSRREAPFGEIIKISV